MIAVLRSALSMYCLLLTARQARAALAEDRAVNNSNRTRSRREHRKSSGDNSRLEKIEYDEPRGKYEARGCVFVFAGCTFDL